MSRMKSLESVEGVPKNGVENMSPCEPITGVIVVGFDSRKFFIFCISQFASWVCDTPGATTVAPVQHVTFSETNVHVMSGPRPIPHRMYRPKGRSHSVGWSQ